MKTELISSFIEKEDNGGENKGKEQKKKKKIDEAIRVIKEYETLIKFKKKEILNIAYREVIFFKRLLKSTERL